MSNIPKKHSKKIPQNRSTNLIKPGLCLPIRCTDSYSVNPSIIIFISFLSSGNNIWVVVILTKIQLLIAQNNINKVLTSFKFNLIMFLFHSKRAGCSLIIIKLYLWDRDDLYMQCMMKPILLLITLWRMKPFSFTHRWFCRI